VARGAGEGSETAGWCVRQKSRSAMTKRFSVANIGLVAIALALACGFLFPNVQRFMPGSFGVMWTMGMLLGLLIFATVIAITIELMTWAIARLIARA
jgi:hypothetical protein